MPLKQLQATPMMAPDREAVGEDVYRIFVKDLVLTCSIGAYPEERLKPQRVRFNVDLRARTSAGPVDDDLANVFSYDTVTAGIRRLIASGHINLVETLAEQIAEYCLADPRIVQARVSVEKLDIEPAAAGVGIEIERHRRSYPAVADLFPRLAGAVARDPRRRGNAGS